VILETLQLTLAMGWEEGRWKTCLVHFINKSLDFGLWLSQELEKRSDPWEESSGLLLPCFNV
jgi:hypothetical protein